MAKQKNLSFKILPEWDISQADKSLIISGGADARFEIELESGKPSFFSTQKSDVRFTRDKLSTADQRVLEELITAEIIVPELQINKPLVVAVTGDDTRLPPLSNKTIKFVNINQNHDFVLIYRSYSTYADLLVDIDYQSIGKPHLFIDAAFHHTLSIGPLVFPGETACIACLQGRISTRWGDEKPPAAPLVVKTYEKVIPELISVELSRIAKGDTSLTNKTVSWNFQDRTTKKDQLLKVPLCPVCNHNKIDDTGALALPWGKDESITNPV